MSVCVCEGGAGSELKDIDDIPLLLEGKKVLSF